MGKYDSEEILINQKTVLDSVFITLTYALFWACLIISLLFPAFMYPQPYDAPLFISIALGLLFFVLAQWMMKRRPLLYSKEKFVLVLGLSIALCLPTLAMNILASFGLSFDWWMLAGMWACWGLSTGLVFPLLGAAWSLIDKVHNSRKSSPKLISVSFVGTACLVLMVLFAPVMLHSVFLAAYCVSLFILFIVIIKRLPEIKQASLDPFLEKFDPRTSPKRFFPVVVGATLSTTASYSVMAMGAVITMVLVAGACFTAGVLMFAGVHNARMPIVNELIERVFFPIAAVCVFLAAFLLPAFQAIPLFILIVNCVMYAIFHWAFLLAQSHRHSFSSPYHFSLGLLNPAIGVLIGCLIAFSLILFGSFPQNYTMAFFALSVVYVIVVSVVPYAADPLLEIDVLNPDITESMDEEKLGLWKKKCRSIAKKASLSPREEEVFELLARGRNAEYIQKRLYISINTAKTHKYRIFRKLNIESHQELIDAIERETPEEP